MSNNKAAGVGSEMPLLFPQWTAPANVRTAITLAVPDATAYGAYNMAMHVGDDAIRVQAHRDALAQQLKVPYWQWLEQVHGVDVVQASADTCALPAPQADACTTSLVNLACAVLTADCLPVLLCNQQGTRVAAVHAGWRGLAAGVLLKTHQHFDASDTVMAYLGPAIGPAAFEVGAEVKKAFVQALGACAAESFVPNPHKPTHYFANLYALARLQLALLGVTAISSGQACTVNDSQFYSYRRQPVTGRFASAIWLAD